MNREVVIFCPSKLIQGRGVCSVAEKIKVPDGKEVSLACDRFYTAVENCWEVKCHTGYGTIQSDHGPQYSVIIQTICLQNDEEFLVKYVNMPMPMCLFHWRDSVDKGSWFISMCHDASETTVFRRKSCTPGGTKCYPGVPRNTTCT